VPLENRDWNGPSLVYQHISTSTSPTKSYALSPAFKASFPLIRSILLVKKTGSLIAPIRHELVLNDEPT
jgi:hypothetical protein